MQRLQRGRHIYLCMYINNATAIGEEQHKFFEGFTYAFERMNNIPQLSMFQIMPASAGKMLQLKPKKDVSKKKISIQRKLCVWHLQIQ